MSLKFKLFVQKNSVNISSKIHNGKPMGRKCSHRTGTPYALGGRKGAFSRPASGATCDPGSSLLEEVNGRPAQFPFRWWSCSTKQLGCRDTSLLGQRQRTRQFTARAAIEAECRHVALTIPTSPSDPRGVTHDQQWDLCLPRAIKDEGLLLT